MEAVEATPERIIRCFGFTRPDCQPCKSTEDIQTTKYDSLGTAEKKPLCVTCRGYLLVGLPRAWESD
jgi:hypothetical protein